MSDAALIAISGLVGVIIGGFITAFATTRSAARTRARAAARVALDDLAQWLRAINYLSGTRERHARKEDDMDALIAVELVAMRPYLRTSWWTDTRADLLAVATDREAVSLSTAARASEGVAEKLASFGDVGVKALRSRASIRQRGAGERAPTDRPRPVERPSNAAPGTAESDLDRDKAAAYALAAEITQGVEEGLQDLAELRTRLDARLWLAEEALDSIVGARDTFMSAAATCETIDRRMRSVRSFFALHGT